MAAVEEGRAQSGFYCSTSGTFFETKEALQDHYKSDFHRYNLKRKVAGLPPVTREWFEARKAQLSASTATTGPVQRVWMDPLTKKKFNSDNTYQTFVRSKKYQDLVLASGQPAPAPIIFVPKEQSAAAAEDAAQQKNRAAPAPGGSDGKKPAYVVKAPSGMPWQHNQDDRQAEAEESANNNAAGAADSHASSEEEEEEGNESGWETASDVDEEEAAAAAAATASASKQYKQQGQRSNNTNTKAAPASKRADADADADGEMASDEGADEEEDGEEWEEWDVRASLFDGHVSRSFEENVTYMYRKYGFYFPDVEYLKDPEGLLKYLGAKLRYGGVPLYQSGNDGNAKRFRSLHGVQRHMVDTNQCRMLYEDNEDEYEDYYDYDSEGGEEEEDDGAGKALALAGADAAAAAGGSFELVVATSGAKGGTVLRTLGHREFARYYRQRHRPADTRPSVVANTVLAQYRALALPALDASAKVDQEQRRAQIKERRHQRTWLAQTLQTNFGPNGFKLPKNVPY